MLRHEFQPGRLITGLSLTLAAVLYAGDAGDAWKTPWFVVIPVVTGGLCLAGSVSAVTGLIRRHKRSEAREARAKSPI
ncbi:hypothetical protein [Streptomyces incanus]|uniref:Integral membrane protein n=1 Tax=Streptomyces incanus TaxID=887453 RepID=A0ABW0XL81_9ACTN